jgi:hypothetical protein
MLSEIQQKGAQAITRGIVFIKCLPIPLGNRDSMILDDNSFAIGTVIGVAIASAITAFSLVAQLGT